jgi:hypothetical protein
MSDNPTTMEAGQELDRLVAELVMGWSLYHYDKGERGSEYWSLLDEHCNAIVYSWRPGSYMTEFKSEKDAFAWFKPSENIGQAWEIEERLRPTHWIDIQDMRTHYDVTIRRNIDDQSPAIATAETLPLAICRAALLAVQHKATP